MRHVFLTGGTGTIGVELLPRLLAEPDSRVTALVRAADDAALAERLRVLRRFWGAELDDGMAQRLQLLRGDIEQPDFGLDAQAWALLATQATHIIHCAASVKLNMSEAQARANAVEPVRRILALARALQQAGRLVKLDVVSTVGVWGCEPGTMPERPLPEVRRFHNTYESAKAEAERVLWEQGDGLPLTVHRPSMVVGRRGDGRVVHHQVFYHLCEFLSGVRTGGVMPALGAKRLDTVPVDWVAAAIVWANATPATAGRVLHLCSGPDEALPVAALRDRVRALWRAQGRRVPPVWTLPRAWLAALVPAIGAFSGPAGRRALKALPPVLAYLAEEQAFGNQASRRWLAEAGLPLPPVADYLEPVLRRYLAERGAAA